MTRETLSAETLDGFLKRGRIVNIRCSDHAGVRAHQRLGLPLELAKATVEADVRDALQNGRFARLQPDWSVSEGYTPRAETPRERWVWNEERTAAYAIVLHRRTWVVKTLVATPAIEHAA